MGTLHCHLLCPRHGSEYVTWMTSLWGFIIVTYRWGTGCSEEEMPNDTQYVAESGFEPKYVYLNVYIWSPCYTPSAVWEPILESRPRRCLKDYAEKYHYSWFRWTGHKANSVFSFGDFEGEGWQRGVWEEEANIILGMAPKDGSWQVSNLV